MAEHVQAILKLRGFKSCLGFRIEWPRHSQSAA